MEGTGWWPEAGPSPCLLSWRSKSGPWGDDAAASMLGAWRRRPDRRMAGACCWQGAMQGLECAWPRHKGAAAEGAPRMDRCACNAMLLLLLLLRNTAA